MAFTIDGTVVQFNLATFESLCKEEKANWLVSSMKGLRSSLSAKTQPSAAQVKQEILAIPGDKRKKYKDALKYLIFSWPGMVDPNKMNVVTSGKITDRIGFQAMFKTMDSTTDFADLQYGISGARAMTPYRLTSGRVRFADDFNNASNLGTGSAFERTWQGYGFLTATNSSVEQKFRTGEKQDLNGKTRGIAQTTRDEYVEFMLASRYSPVRSLGESGKKLKKDTQQSLQTMTGIHGKKQAQLHFQQHARFVRSVRRACKGGIAMVASHQGYRAVDAKVHFVLDGLGDLGKMARKDALPGKGDYVAITSSELCFCCRYWDDPTYPLSPVVKFYINGDRVLPPWQADYTDADAEGNNVYTNQEAWLRYLLCQELIGTKKAFPKFEGTIDGSDDED